MRPRTGAELELLAPAGSSRAVLADELANNVGGRVQANWHIDSEPSAHSKIDLFHHITPSFDVIDKEGSVYARLVDDITIRRDLNAKHRSELGWGRVVSDDPRFLRMMADRLEPIGSTFDDVSSAMEALGLTCIEHEHAIKMVDSSGASVALLAGVPGERERVCELISPPLTKQLPDWFDKVTATAARLGFVVPAESATHFHYDAEPFRSPGVFRRLIWNFVEHGDMIRQRFRTNPNCSRTGLLPTELLDLVDSDDYETKSWNEIASRVRTMKDVVKYLDVNLTNLIADDPKVDTVEFRMLPGSISGEGLREMLVLMDAIVEQIRLGDSGGAGLAS